MPNIDLGTGTFTFAGDTRAFDRQIRSSQRLLSRSAQSMSSAVQTVNRNVSNLARGGSTRGITRLSQNVRNADRRFAEANTTIQRTTGETKRLSRAAEQAAKSFSNLAVSASSVRGATSGIGSGLASAANVAQASGRIITRSFVLTVAALIVFRKTLTGLIATLLAGGRGQAFQQFAMGLSQVSKGFNDAAKGGQSLGQAIKNIDFSGLNNSVGKLGREVGRNLGNSIKRGARTGLAGLGDFVLRSVDFAFNPANLFRNRDFDTRFFRDRAARANARSAVESSRRFTKEQQNLKNATNASSLATRGLADALGGLSGIVGVASRGLSGLGNTMASNARNFKLFATAALGVLGAVKAVQLAVRALELRAFSGRVIAVTQSFNRLSASAGKSATELQQRFRQATRGYISDTNLLILANTALISQNETIINRLPGVLEKATQLFLARGQDVEQGLNDITLAILRQSPLILDNAGIYVKLAEVNATYARSVGKTVEQLSAAEKQIAFFNATERAAIKATSELNDVTNEGARALVRYNNQLEKFRVNLGKLAESPGARALISLVSGGLQALNTLIGTTSNEIEDRTIPPLRNILNATKDIDTAVRAIPRDNILRFRVEPPEISPVTQIIRAPEISELRRGRGFREPLFLGEDIKVPIDPELELRSRGEPFRNLREIDDRLRSELDALKEDFEDTFVLNLDLGPELYNDLTRIDSILTDIQSSFSEFTLSAITDFKNVGEAVRDLGRQLRNLVLQELVASPIAQFARNFFRGAVNHAFNVPGDVNARDVISGQRTQAPAQGGVNVNYNVQGVSDPGVVESALQRSYRGNQNQIVADANRNARLTAGGYR